MHKLTLILNYSRAWLCRCWRSSMEDINAVFFKNLLVYAVAAWPVLILIALVSYFTSRSIFMPLSALANKLLCIAEGRLDVPLEDTSHAPEICGHRARGRGSQRKSVQRNAFEQRLEADRKRERGAQQKFQKHVKQFQAVMTSADKTVRDQVEALRSAVHSLTESAEERCFGGGRRARRLGRRRQFRGRGGGNRGAGQLQPPKSPVKSNGRTRTWKRPCSGGPDQPRVATSPPPPNRWLHRKGYPQYRLPDQSLGVERDHRGRARGPGGPRLCGGCRGSKGLSAQTAKATEAIAGQISAIQSRPARLSRRSSRLPAA